MVSEVQTCYRHSNEPTRIRCTRCGRPICPDCMHEAPVGHHCPVCAREGARVQRRFRFRPRPEAGRLTVTNVLLGVNAIVFAAEILLGGSTNLATLVDMGALFPPLVAGGEWWRLLTAMFLHVGPFHLAFNSFGLWIFGSLIEGVLGRARFAAIYFLTGITASAASFAFGSPERVAAGASGAIFGLLGAWLAYNWRRRETGLAQANIQGALVLVGLNLVLGLSVPGIDNIAHIGGLVAGIGAGLAAEGFGTGSVRMITRVAGLSALAVTAALLTAWRVASLTA